MFYLCPSISIFAIAIGISFLLGWDHDKHVAALLLFIIAYLLLWIAFVLMVMQTLHLARRGRRRTS